MEVLILEIFTLVLMGSDTKSYGMSLISENIDQKYYCSVYYDVSINKYVFKCGASLRFWENSWIVEKLNSWKGWINEIDPFGSFQWYFRYWLARRLQDDERQINIWKKIVSRFRGKLVKMIKDAGSIIDDYAISPKIRQILLHWDHELTDKDFFINLTN